MAKLLLLVRKNATFSLNDHYNWVTAKKAQLPKIFDFLPKKLNFVSQNGAVAKNTKFCLGPPLCKFKSDQKSEKWGIFCKIRENRGIFREFLKSGKFRENPGIGTPVDPQC